MLDYCHNTIVKLAFNSREPFVQKGNRWIASLSDGSTVFEDKTPGEDSAWQRLSKYVKLNKLAITNLRLEANGRFINLISYKTDDGRPQLDGYWQSSSIGKIFGGISIDFYKRGIGYIKDLKINIIWVDNKGTVSHEIRDFREGDRAAILNERF